MLSNQESKTEFPNKNIFIALSNTDVCLWNVKSGCRMLHLPSSDCHTAFTSLSWKVNFTLQAQVKNMFYY